MIKYILDSFEDIFKMKMSSNNWRWLQINDDILK